MPSESIPDVGRRLGAVRLHRGLSQGTVARRAGIAASYLSRIENGKIQPTLPTVLRIARAVRADLGDIVGPDPLTSRGHALCPVTSRGCLLDLIRPDATEGDEHAEFYTPREVRLLRRLATWMKRVRPDRLRAMEILLDDLMQVVLSGSVGVAPPTPGGKARRGK